MVGLEARAKHNYLTHTTGMRDNAFNGDGITVYGPNMNLVKGAPAPHSGFCPASLKGRSFQLPQGSDRRCCPRRPALGPLARGVLRGSAAVIGADDGLRHGHPGGGAQRHAEGPALHAGRRLLQALVRALSRAHPPLRRCCLSAAAAVRSVAYDLEGNGGLPSRVYFDAQVDTRSFWEHYMPVFHDCIVSAKAMHAMCSCAHGAPLAPKIQRALEPDPVAMRR